MFWQRFHLWGEVQAGADWRESFARYPPGGPWGWPTAFPGRKPGENQGKTHGTTRGKPWEDGDLYGKYGSFIVELCWSTYWRWWFSSSLCESWPEGNQTWFAVQSSLHGYWNRTNIYFIGLDLHGFPIAMNVWDWLSQDFVWWVRKLC